jgi:hypothetical protein
MGGRAVEGAPAAKAAKRQSREGGKKTKPRRRLKDKAAKAAKDKNRVRPGAAQRMGGRAVEGARLERV